ncbi:MAG: ABC transporter permease [Candidatus Ventricola sp.]
MTQTKIAPNRLKRYRRMWRDIRADWILYLLLVPGMVYVVLFHYIPMLGVANAFRDYSAVTGPGAWRGLEIFEKLFSRVAFQRAFRNNIIISLFKLLCGFPVPIILSLMINEIRRPRVKKFIQTAIILPNFISWFIISGLLFAMFSVTSGAIPGLIRALNPNAVITNVLQDKDCIRTVVIGSYVWQASGMGTIVYLAAITGIDQQLYEAAMIDGAGKWQQMVHITLPTLLPTIIVLFIFRVGSVMNAGFDQIYALSNSLVVSKIDIIDTYVFKIGIEQAKFSEATAAGLFKSAIGLVLVLTTNYLAKKVDPDSGIM